MFLFHTTASYNAAPESPLAQPRHGQSRFNPQADPRGYADHSNAQNWREPLRPPAQRESNSWYRTSLTLTAHRSKMLPFHTTTNTLLHTTPPPKSATSPWLTSAKFPSRPLTTATHMTGVDHCVLKSYVDQKGCQV